MSNKEKTAQVGRMAGLKEALGLDQRKVILVDEIMSAVLQTDYFDNIIMTDPNIVAADAEMQKVIDGLEQTLSKEEIDSLQVAMYRYAIACEIPAILYGIYVADAIREIAANPSALSRCILERAGRGTG